MTEDVINAMRELIRCYEFSRGDHPINKEVAFWRERFLATAQLPKNGERGAVVWMAYLGCPSETMMETGPEKYLQELLANEN